MRRTPLDTPQPRSGRMDGEDAPRSRNLRPLRLIIPYVLRYRIYLAAAAMALFLAAGATLAVPVAVRRMIDHGFTAADGTFIDLYFAMMVLVVFVLAVASASRYYFVTWLGERVVSDLRVDVFGHVLRLSPGFFDKSQSGEVISRLTADTALIKAAVGTSASVALRNLVLFVGATILMAVTSPRLAAMVIVVIPAIVIPIIVFGRAVRRRTRYAQDTLAEAAAYAGEAIGAVRTVQAFNRERGAIARFGDGVERAFNAARGSMAARSILTAAALFIIFSSVVGVLWIGAQDVLAGRLTPGSLGQFVLYAVFAAGALGELSQVWGEVAQAAGAAERLDELLKTESDVKPAVAPVPLPNPSDGAVRFDNVVFAYPTRPEESVLNGLTFDVKPGQTAAVVGPSGAGKSTVFQLLLRFYDPAEGTVFVDGVPVARGDASELRDRIAFVPQEPVIFAASVRENIRFGRPDARAEEIEEAARLAHADEFVQGMADGYETLLGERGVTLSGGQRQRIAIARAVLKDAPILLLDEATSALDAQSEAFVQEALDRLMAGRTTLVIAHRLATVQRADVTLVMDKGRLVEKGTHAELVAKGGLYAELAQLQFNMDKHARAIEAAE